MKIPNITTDYQTSLDIPREQRRIRRKRFSSNPGLIMGFTVFVPIMMAAIIIPVVANADPSAMAIADRLRGPSLKHLFGTDESGRDLMIRILYGARISLLAGGTVALLSCVLGMVIGIYASYLKILDHILMRICEDLIVMPGVLLMVILTAVLGASNLNVIIALTIVYTPSVTRTVCSSALVAREQPHVEAAKIQGAGSGRILRKLISSGVISPLMAQASFIFVQAIISEASLSFLGADIPALAASRGNILQGSRQVLQKVPWTAIFPGPAVVLCVLSLNFLGDGLRDYLDPRTAGRKKR